MNKVIMIGRLTKDAELKFTPGTGTAVATFTLIVAEEVQLIEWARKSSLELPRKN